MKIGELAKITDCSVQTIRYYEKEGLISANARSEGNFRLYDHRSAVERLLFIKHCRRLDMSLSDIQQMLRLKDSPSAQCDDINQLLARHLEAVEKRIADLESLHHQLQVLQHACSAGRTVEQCGILQNLSNR
ncbi:MAG: Cd(II)/Pb(II)-responsive transcriptional regulator [Gammaproteobacteria bacterium]|nr:Cd(II)/Pb(II)-responsive transcriptional regulator [Gammaproteobacteria bacterium]